MDMVHTGRPPFYLTVDQQSEILQGLGFSLHVASSAHFFDPDATSTIQRYVSVIKEVFAQFNGDALKHGNIGDVLVVTHGHCVGAVCEYLCAPARIPWEVEHCAWVILEPSPAGVHAPWRMVRYGGLHFVE